MDAYLDIETTGLSSYYDGITVIGVWLYDGMAGKLVQLVGEEANRLNLLGALQGAETIYTYNGSRFDIPFIRACLGVNLAELYRHHDLMYECWKRRLFGGFKAVEVQLGIPRQLKGLSGFDAVLLWQRYREFGDQQALGLLLEYNKEDVLNLSILRQRLFQR
ncbi:MAG: exonuclease [Chloroflexi bacterium]|nr:MAG: exonuclease [Chloroflexota bacterium]RLC96595.1 MAG: exonuclease [Chloroflexota bacterium]